MENKLKNQFGDWAMMQVKISCYCNIIGGCIAFFYQEPLVGTTDIEMTAGIYGITIGTLLLPFFWPFSFLGGAVKWHQYYLPMAILCVLLSIVDFFTVPTALAGMILILAGLTYLVAFFKREKPQTSEQVLSPR
jgi:hypothetical protein